MLENLPLIFWQNYIRLLSKQELCELLCKLSETSKYLYNIYKLIKLNNKILTYQCPYAIKNNVNVLKSLLDKFQIMK